MVTKRYLDSKLVEPIRQQLREEGKKRERQRWVAWNRRRLEAEAIGESFTEPPPGSDPANCKG